MKRLTTDAPDGNFQTMLNFVYGKDGWAHIRYDGKSVDVPLTSWAKTQCVESGCDEFTAETPEEIDQLLCDRIMDCPGCPVALAYTFASQAAHLRDRLKMYEDILFVEDGTERIPLEQLQAMVSLLPNGPLTLEELREMDGEPVLVIQPHDFLPPFWGIVDAEDESVSGSKYCGVFEDYDTEWLAYRRKPEADVSNLDTSEGEEG